MQLTIHTDYALRTLIALGLNAPDKMTAAEIGADPRVREAYLGSGGFGHA